MALEDEEGELSRMEGNFKIDNLRYSESEKASKSGAPLSGDLDAPPMWSPNHE
jgi:hypothetical protein